MLNWIVQNKTVLTFKLCLFAKIICLKYLNWNCVLYKGELFENGSKRTKAPTIRSPTTYHENYPIKTNQTCRTLLEKQGGARKWCTPVDPRIWPMKSRTTSSNIHTGCNPEDLPEAMNDRKTRRERVRDIRAGCTTWWWWYV